MIAWDWVWAGMCCLILVRSLVSGVDGGGGGVCDRSSGRGIRCFAIHPVDNV